MEDNKRKAIYEELIKMGFKASYKGIDYIVEAADILSREIYNPPTLIGDVYQKVALKYNTRKALVERCIRFSIESYYNDAAEIPEVLEGDPYTGKLSNKEFLHRIVKLLY